MAPGRASNVELRGLTDHVGCDSRGDWEGNTLVVETTTFHDRTRFEGSSKDMLLVERWTRVSDDEIDYRFTINDPATWTRLWSASFDWHKGGTPHESACHQDNIGLYGILSGARADEQKAAANHLQQASRYNRSRPRRRPSIRSPRCGLNWG